MRGHLLRQSEASSVTLVAHRARHHHSSSGHGRSSSSRSHALVVAEKRVAAAQIHTAHAELETVHAEMNQVRVCNEALSLTVERLRERCAMQERSNESQTEALITVETRYSAEIEAMASAHAQSMASAVAHAERRLDDMHASRFRALADGHNVAIQKVVRVAVLEKQRAIRNGVEAAEHSAAAALDAALVGIRAEHAAACEGVRRDLMERQLEQEHQLRETYRVDLATGTVQPYGVSACCEINCWPRSRLRHDSRLRLRALLSSPTLAKAQAVSRLRPFRIRHPNQRCLFCMTQRRPAAPTTHHPARHDSPPALCSSQHMPLGNSGPQQSSIPNHF